MTKFALPVFVIMIVRGALPAARKLLIWGLKLNADGELLGCWENEEGTSTTNAHRTTHNLGCFKVWSPYVDFAAV